MADETPTPPAPPLTPLLDLDTLVERPRILIDKKLYDILSPNELSVIELHRFESIGKEIEALLGHATLSAQDETRLSKILAELTDRIMVGVPDEVRVRLNDSHRLAVSEVFTQLPLQQALMTVLAAGAMATPTGAK